MGQGALAWFGVCSYVLLGDDMSFVILETYEIPSIFGKHKEHRSSVIRRMALLS